MFSSPLLLFFLGCLYTSCMLPVLCLLFFLYHFVSSGASLCFVYILSILLIKKKKKESIKLFNETTIGAESFIFVNVR